MKRMQITLPDDVYKLIVNQPNKSRFIARAIEDRFVEESQDTVVLRLKDHLINDEQFMASLQTSLSARSHQTTDWGA